MGPEEYPPAGGERVAEKDLQWQIADFKFEI